MQADTAFQTIALRPLYKNPDLAERSSLRARESLHHREDGSRLPRSGVTEAVSPRKRLKEKTTLHQLHKNPDDQNILSQGTGV